MRSLLEPFRSRLALDLSRQCQSCGRFVTPGVFMVQAPDSGLLCDGCAVSSALAILGATSNRASRRAEVRRQRRLGGQRGRA